MKLYLLGLVIFFVGAGIIYIKDRSDGWKEFILVTILNIWIIPLMLITHIIVWFAGMKVHIYCSRDVGLGYISSVVGYIKEDYLHKVLNLEDAVRIIAGKTKRDDIINTKWIGSDGEVIEWKK